MPHCPTYLNSKNENESPRGRISLIQAVASQKLPVSTKIFSHLDHCLECKACEKACPSAVPYTQLLNKTKHQFFNHQQPSIFIRLLLSTVASHSKLALLQKTLRLLSFLKIQKVIHFFRLMHLFSFTQFIPEKFSTVETNNNPNTDNQRNVALFTGCMSPLMDSRTISDTTTLLSKIGFNVIIPKQQQCCGALHYHNNQHETAIKMMQKNSDLFTSIDVEAILSIATGCCDMLQNTDKLLDSPPKYHADEICYFLFQHANLQTENFNKANETIIVHTPCSLRNGLKQTNHAINLLGLIKGLNIIELTDQTCCGSAGTHMIRSPTKANEFIHDKLQQISATKPTYLATSNIGCALHFQNNLTAQQLDTKVLHPVSILLKYLK